MKDAFLRAGLIPVLTFIALVSVSSQRSEAGTGVVSGIVVSSSGEIMSGASAYLLPTRQRVPIAEDGSYSIGGVDNTSYHIAISSPGYKFYLTRLPLGESMFKKVNLVMITASETASDEAGSELERIIAQCSADKLTELKETVLNPNTPKSASAGRERVGAASTTTAHHEEALKASGTSSETETMTMLEKLSVNNQSNDIETIDSKEEGTFVMSLEVVPNPTSEFANITFKLGAQAKVMLEIYRLESGQRIVLQDCGQHGKGENQVQVNLSSLPAGTYTALVRASTCHYALTTFIKN